MKSLYKSKVFWLAITQSLIGVVAVFETAYPGVGVLLVAKTVLDIVLRIETTTSITPSVQTATPDQG